MVRGTAKPPLLCPIFRYFCSIWTFHTTKFLPWYKISVAMLTFAPVVGQVASGGAAASEKMTE